VQNLQNWLPRAVRIMRNRKQESTLMRSLNHFPLRRKKYGHDSWLESIVDCDRVPIYTIVLKIYSLNLFVMYITDLQYWQCISEYYLHIVNNKNQFFYRVRGYLNSVSSPRCANIVLFSRMNMTSTKNPNVIINGRDFFFAIIIQSFNVIQAEH